MAEKKESGGEYRPGTYGENTRKFLESIGYFRNQPDYLAQMVTPGSRYYMGADAFASLPLSQQNMLWQAFEGMTSRQGRGNVSDYFANIAESQPENVYGMLRPSGGTYGREGFLQRNQARAYQDWLRSALPEGRAATWRDVVYGVPGGKSMLESPGYPFKHVGRERWPEVYGKEAPAELAALMRPRKSFADFLKDYDWEGAYYGTPARQRGEFVTQYKPPTRWLSY